MERKMKVISVVMGRKRWYLVQKPRPTPAPEIVPEPAPVPAPSR